MAQQDRISILVSLEGADASLKQAVASARQTLASFSGTARDAGTAAQRSFEQVGAASERMSTALKAARTQLVALAAGYLSFSGAKQIISLADAYAGIQSRLKLATAGQQEFQRALDGTFAISTRLGAPLNETATLYGKLQGAVRALGGTQQDALGLTESIGQALRISGASAGDSAAALLQFGQALASGVLRGDEFNSVMENAPRLAKALADGLGVSTGKLRQMAEAGQLTADVVVKALQSQSGALKAEFAQLPRTVSQSLAALQNAFMRWVGGVNESTGATAKLSAALGFVADHLDAFMTALQVLAAGALAKIAASLLPQLVASLQAAGVAAVAAGNKIRVAFTAATLPIEFATAAVGRFNVALAAVGGFVAGWEIGTMLREKFAPVAAIGDILGASLGAVDGAVRAFTGLLGDAFTQGPVQAVRAFGATIAGLGTAWLDMTAQARIALMGTEQLVQTQGASLQELQARISAVRLGLAESVSSGMKAVEEATAKLDAVVNKLDQDASKAQGTVNAALSGIAAVRDAQTAAIAQSLDEQTAAVQRSVQAQKDLLDRQTVSQQQRIATETALLVQQNTEQAAMRQQATAQTLDLLQQETAAKLAAAATDGKTLEERRSKALGVEESILTGQRDVWARAATAYQQHINALIGEEQRHLQAAFALEQSRLLINADIESKIRELRRQTMTDGEALEDRKTQIAQLQSAARQAIAQGEYDKAKEFAQQSVALAEAVGRTKGEEEGAITNLRSAQTLLNQAIANEEAAHKQAAAAAATARAGIEQQLATAKTQVEELNNAIAQVQAVRLEVDASRITPALADVQKAIAEKEVLLPIQADLKAAQQKLQEFDTALKAGKSITLDADITQGRAALDRLQAYAKEKANIDLQLSTAAAQGRIADLSTRIQTLNTLETASRHVVKDNVPQVRTEIDSLQGRNTTSTHTITVRQVEARATGGMVGELSGASRRLAGGGRVSGPGTETSDSIPALLSRGEFVVRAAAVRQFGEAFFASLNAGFMPPQPARFAAGGLVGVDSTAPAPMTGAPIHLHFGQQQVGPIYAAQDVAEQLRQAALMFGAVA